ncbi:hypothetical protein SAMN05443248_4115 [Bradyrhizobium erythrophlei]|uniref:Uncharacterized protein n=1 Tax=Bradyrhizobium erythrophlei TaxID=1437360 RepID=A0A1M5R8B0_9BRAD|nr:hypothetical protein SAMN05443248_4115 [Bradyrhizobium erythrophlei]
MGAYALNGGHSPDRPMGPLWLQKAAIQQKEGFSAFLTHQPTDSFCCLLSVNSRPRVRGGRRTRLYRSISVKDRL